MRANHWPDRRVLDLLGIEVPIIQAPMAGFTTPAMIQGAAQAGGLGSLPLGMATPDDARLALDALGDIAGAPINLNFFCHKPELDDPVLEREWRHRLQPYFEEMGMSQPAWQTYDSSFGTWQCELVERVRPKVVSFHFGLPDRLLLERVRSTGAKIICSATTVREACWLEAQGCDAIIAQGIEAGGHRGSFLDMEIETQLGTLALVPQVVNAVRVPVIAAGGIGDARGIAAALTLGASAVQLGTAYLFCPEARVSPAFRTALEGVRDVGTVITNVLSGRPARALRNRLVRALGPLSDDVPRFPEPAFMLRPLSQMAEREGRRDFMAVWCGQGTPLCSPQPAEVLTRRLANEAQAMFAVMAGSAPRIGAGP
jgi:nitronate monooxygenase